MTSTLDRPNGLPEDFWDLVQQMCDETASDADRDRLEGYLLTSREATRVLAGYLRTNAELQWIYRGANVTSAPSSPELLPVKDQSTTSSPRSILPLKRLTGWMSGSEFVVGSLLILAVVAAFWGLATFSLHVWRSARGERAQTIVAETSKTDVYVAELVNEHNCKWAAPAGEERLTPRLHTRFVAGQTVDLAAGVAEFKFLDGAVLALEGPVQFIFRNTKNGFLERGRLVAHVPPQAVGFTVTTAAATVVDLGTEFAVEADEHGTTEVQVFQGKVELRPDAKRGDSSPASEAIILTAGTARRVEKDNSGADVVIREIAPTPNRFVRPSTGTLDKPLRVEGAYASSTFSDRNWDVRHLIDGQGLQDGHHTADLHDTMWRSHIGEVKNVYVSFDFGTTCRVDAMKAWNYNAAQDQAYQFNGVKQADIYVSTSGKGEPWSQPDEWTLVAANQQFLPADGTPSYSSPTSVAMGGALARFVAIVVDEAFGSNPNLPRPNGPMEKVHLGKLSTIRDVSSLDLTGTFPYALALGRNDHGETIAGVPFMIPKATPGVKLDIELACSFGVRTEFGADSDNRALGAILNQSLFTNQVTAKGSIQLAVTPGKTYKLQLLYNETAPEVTRVQNLKINDVLAVEELVQVTGIPRVYTYQFEAPSNVLTIDFSPATNCSYTWTYVGAWTHVGALTLELLSAAEPAPVNILSKDATSNDVSLDWVGLSEVQFFGSRIEPSAPRQSINRKNQ